MLTNIQLDLFVLICEFLINECIPFIIPYFWTYHILLFLFFETLPKITTTQLECLFFIKDLLLTNEANRLQ